MFAHVTVGALDIELSRKFYDATPVELAIKPGVAEGRWLAYNSGNCIRRRFAFRRESRPL
jgi:hypothetical protein